MTPEWMVRALLQHVPEIGGTILEPCVGDGAIARHLQHAPNRVLTNDLDFNVRSHFHLDAAHYAIRQDEQSLWAEVGYVDWVITNPPFKAEVMLPILKNALKTARVGVAFLGRLSFLEPTKGRGEWLATNPPSRYLVTERHSFTGNGKSDSVTTAWMIWSKQPLSGRPIEILHGYKHAGG